MASVSGQPAATRVGSVLKTKTAVFAVFCTLGKGNYRLKPIVAVTRLFEEISRFR